MGVKTFCEEADKTRKKNDVIDKVGVVKAGTLLCLLLHVVDSIALACYTYTVVVLLSKHCYTAAPLRHNVEGD